MLRKMLNKLILWTYCTDRFKVKILIALGFCLFLKDTYC